MAGVPSAPGIYAWWMVPGAIDDVPRVPHLSGFLGLLYVGIAPRALAGLKRMERR